MLYDKFHIEPEFGNPLEILPFSADFYAVFKVSFFVTCVEWIHSLRRKPSINSHFLLSIFHDAIYQEEKWWQLKSAQFDQKL